MTGSWCHTQGAQREMWCYFRNLDIHSLSRVGKEQEVRPVKKCNQQNRGSEVSGPAGEGEVKTLRDVYWWLSLCFVLLSWIPSLIIMFSKEVSLSGLTQMGHTILLSSVIDTKDTKDNTCSPQKRSKESPMKACVRLLRKRGLVSPLKSWNGPQSWLQRPSIKYLGSRHFLCPRGWIMELEGGQKNQHTRHVCTYRNSCVHGMYTTMFMGGRREGGEREFLCGIIS